MDAKSYLEIMDIRDKFKKAGLSGEVLKLVLGLRGEQLRYVVEMADAFTEEREPDWTKFSPEFAERAKKVWDESQKPWEDQKQ